MLNKTIVKEFEEKKVRWSKMGIRLPSLERVVFHILKDKPIRNIAPVQKSMKIPPKQKLIWLKEFNDFIFYRVLSDKEKKQRFKRRFAKEKW